MEKAAVLCFVMGDVLFCRRGVFGFWREDVSHARD